MLLFTNVLTFRRKQLASTLEWEMVTKPSSKMSVNMCQTTLHQTQKPGIFMLITMITSYLIVYKLLKVSLFLVNKIYGFEINTLPQRLIEITSQLTSVNKSSKHNVLLVYFHNFKWEVSPRGGVGGGDTIFCDVKLCILMEIYDIVEELPAPFACTQNGCGIFFRNTGKFAETERRQNLEDGLISNPSLITFMLSV